MFKPWCQWYNWHYTVFKGAKDPDICIKTDKTTCSLLKCIVGTIKPRPLYYSKGSFTWLSIPTANRVRKNITDHSCGTGSLDTASGYTMNAIPGPWEQNTPRLQENIKHRILFKPAIRSANTLNCRYVERYTTVEMHNCFENGIKFINNPTFSYFISKSKSFKNTELFLKL